MNGKRPVFSEVLAEVRRGPSARLVVTFDEWPDGEKSINIGAFRSSSSDGHWFCRRSVTVYPRELPAVIAALLRASVEEQERDSEAGDAA